MNLKEFLKNINTLIEKDPSILEMSVITSIDDEGNGYNELYFTPSVGMFIDNEDFHSCEEDYKDYKEWIDSDDGELSLWKPNAICIN